VHTPQTETHSHHAGGEKYGVVARFLDIYQRSNAAAPQTSPPLVSRMYGGALDNTYIKAIALTDLHLHLNYISPLTTLKLQRYVTDPSALPLRRGN
jgi:hypothetical protein